MFFVNLVISISKTSLSTCVHKTIQKSKATITITYVSTKLHRKGISPVVTEEGMARIVTLQLVQLIGEYKRVGKWNR